MIVPRLLYVVNVDWFFISHRLPLALAAQAAGFEVHVATASTGCFEEIERHGIQVHRLDIDRRSAHPFAAFRLLKTLIQLMRSLRPSVVHLVTIKPVLLGGIAARLTSIPCVIAAISGLGYVFTAKGFGSWLRRLVVVFFYRIALGSSNVRIVFQNVDDRSLLQRYTGIKAEKTILIRGSGIDLDQWKATPLPEGVPIVMMAARLLRDKGVFEFFEAARIVTSQCEVRFVLVGDLDPGNPASITFENLTDWANSGFIEHWGHCSDMQKIIAQASIMVLPSYREGLPKVLIEAAACGRPVITTDVPGCRDAIESGTTGLLVPVYDSVSLANAIMMLVNEPIRMKKMGFAGRRLAEAAFNIREVAALHVSLYKNETHSEKQ